MTIGSISAAARSVTMVAIVRSRFGSRLRTAPKSASTTSTVINPPKWEKKIS